jgi:hypothetical protein
LLFRCDCHILTSLLFGCFQKLPAQSCHENNQEEDSEQKDKIALAPTSTRTASNQSPSSEANCTTTTTSGKEVAVELGESKKQTMSDKTKEQGGREDGRNSKDLNSDVEAATEWQYLPSSDAAFDGAICAICCEEYTEGEEICHLQNPSCCHFFHFKCMGRWLMLHSNCPCCNENYLREDKEEEKIYKERRRTIDESESNLSACFFVVNVL